MQVRLPAQTTMPKWRDRGGISRQVLDEAELLSSYFLAVIPKVAEKVYGIVASVAQANVERTFDSRQQ